MIQIVQQLERVLYLHADTAHEERLPPERAPEGAFQEACVSPKSVLPKVRFKKPGHDALSQLL